MMGCVGRGGGKQVMKPQKQQQMRVWNRTVEKC